MFFCFVYEDCYIYIYRERVREKREGERIQKMKEETTKPRESEGCPNNSEYERDRRRESERDTQRMRERGNQKEREKKEREKEYRK